MAARPSKDARKVLAIIGLCVNAFALPGLGSLIGGRKTAGIWQLVLFIVAIPLSFILIGIPLLIAAWIWGIVTGVEMVKEHV